MNLPSLRGVEEDETIPSSLKLRRIEPCRAEALAKENRFPRSRWSLAVTVIMVLLAYNLTACGTKGGLRSPSQIAAQQAKQASKDAKAAQQQSPATNAAPQPVSQTTPLETPIE